MDRRGDRDWLTRPRALERQLARHREGRAGVPAEHARTQREPARRRCRGLARAGQRHRQPGHADQLSRPERRGHRPGDRRRLGVRAPRRPPIRLLAGRRGQLRARQAVRRRRARDGRCRHRRGQRRQAGRIRLPDRHPISDGRCAAVSEPGGGARRLPELRHAARGAGPGAERQRAGSRPRRRRHPHHQRPRSRPVRPADLHAAGPARVVRQAVGR